MLVGSDGKSQRLRCALRTRRSLQEALDHHVFALDPLVCTRGLGVGHCPGADSDRWGAWKFTIGPFTAPGWSRASLRGDQGSVKRGISKAAPDSVIQLADVTVSQMGLSPVRDSRLRRGERLRHKIGGGFGGGSGWEVCRAINAWVDRCRHTIGWVG